MKLFRLIANPTHMRLECMARQLLIPDIGANFWLLHNTGSRPRAGHEEQIRENLDR